MSVALDIASSVLGFFGAVLLLITPIKGIPYRRTMEIAAALDSKDLLSSLAQQDAKAANAQLANVMRIEPSLLFWAALCLCGSFVLALGKHLF